MIYNLIAYYGAFMKGELLFTLTLSITDSQDLTIDPPPEDEVKVELIKLIEAEGFYPQDFEFRWVTQRDLQSRNGLRMSNPRGENSGGTPYLS